jgi:hypothetical protein
MDTQGVKQLLFDHHIRLEKQAGKRISVSELAEYVGIKPKTFEHIYSGRRPPTMAQLKILATVFGDQKFYDVVGVPRDDPSLKYVQRHWGKIPPDVQKKITDMFTPYTSDTIPEKGKTETP